MSVAKALARIAPRLLVGEAWSHPIIPSLEGIRDSKSQRR